MPESITSLDSWAAQFFLDESANQDGQMGSDLGDFETKPGGMFQLSYPCATHGRSGISG